MLKSALDQEEFEESEDDMAYALKWVPDIPDSIVDDGEIYTETETTEAMDPIEAEADDVKDGIDHDDHGMSIKLDTDVFILPGRTSPRQRLSISFALAQSSVLSVFEARIQKRVEEYKYVS